MHDLVAWLAAAPDQTGLCWRKGVVTSASPLRVTLGASTSDTPAARHASYTPVQGDVVSVLQIGAALLVLDAIVA